MIFNVNVKVEHQHFVLLKPRSKTVAERIGHVVLKGEDNGLCAFTAALQIAKAAGALEPESSWDKVGDKQTHTEFETLKRTKSIKSSRNFAALMQVKALYEQITAHMHRGETAAQEAARASGRKESQQSDWLKKSSHVLEERQQAVDKYLSSADIESGRINEGAQQEALEAETEFHKWTFECIKREYRDEGICSGTWIPVWAAAFNETVHMYEVSPVRTQWDEALDLFPETVFDMLDETRKLEQAELVAGRDLKMVRTAARITSQEWYPKKFARKKRGAAGAEAEVDTATGDDVAEEMDAASIVEEIQAVSMKIDGRVPTNDAFNDGLGDGRSTNVIFQCENNCGFENSDKGLVERHEEVCGITLPFEGA